MENPIKMDDLGVPPFEETSIEDPKLFLANTMKNILFRCYVSCPQCKWIGFRLVMSEVFQVDSRCSQKVSPDRLLHKNTVYDIN